MGVLAMVQSNVVDRAHVELLAAKLELEDERCKVVSLEFQLVGEQKKLEKAQKACTVANERWDEVMTCNEDLCAQSIKEQEEANLKIARLEKDLAETRAPGQRQRRRGWRRSWRKKRPRQPLKGQHTPTYASQQ
ncbi:hypothetical protein CsSME_00022534 [Camellia sinensis var. sinensis]